MGKVILLIILLFGASLYFPQTRPAALDFLSPVLNPAFVWQTRGEMDQIARELQTLNREGRTLPRAGKEFSDWVLQNFQGGSSLDAWGREYTLKVWADSVGILSNGPDREMHTEDDVLVTTRILRDRRR